jgi:hypothetical protein
MAWLVDYCIWILLVYQLQRPFLMLNHNSCGWMKWKYIHVYSIVKRIEYNDARYIRINMTDIISFTITTFSSLVCPLGRPLSLQLTQRVVTTIKARQSRKTSGRMFLPVVTFSSYCCTCLSSMENVYSDVRNLCCRGPKGMSSKGWRVCKFLVL